MIIYITRPFSVYNTYKRYDAIYILARDVQNDNMCVCVCAVKQLIYIILLLTVIVISCVLSYGWFRLRVINFFIKGILYATMPIRVRSKYT